MVTMYGWILPVGTFFEHPLYSLIVESRHEARIRRLFIVVHGRAKEGPIRRPRRADDQLLTTQEHESEHLLVQYHI